jgi:starch phosphorylase
VGDDNIFIFGLSTEQVASERAAGYQPLRIYEQNLQLKAVLDALAGGLFSPGEPGRYRDLVSSLLWGGDHYLLLADFESYVAAQARVDALYRDREAWARKAITNVAGMGMFSADRTIAEYANQVWQIEPQR